MNLLSVQPLTLDAQAEFIERLGGATEVSRIVLRRRGKRRRPQAVSNWKRRGIPFEFRAALVLEANERRVHVPPGFLGEFPSPPEPPAPMSDPGDDVPFL